MRVKLTEVAIRQYQKLTSTLQKQADKQFEYLMNDVRHPSLHAKKYKGDDDLWQARIDRNWRFYFYIVEPHYIIISIIKHPK